MPPKSVTREKNNAHTRTHTPERPTKINNPFIKKVLGKKHEKRKRSGSHMDVKVMIITHKITTTTTNKSSGIQIEDDIKRKRNNNEIRHTRVVQSMPHLWQNKL